MLLTLVSWPRRGRNCTGSRTEPKPQLTEEQWILIADLFPTPEITRLGGRPRVESRVCVEGILWVLRSGARSYGARRDPVFGMGNNIRTCCR